MFEKSVCSGVLALTVVDWLLGGQAEVCFGISCARIVNLKCD